MKKQTEVLWEGGLEVNAEDPMYMFMSHHQNAAQCHDLMIDNKSFGNVTEF